MRNPIPTDKAAHFGAGWIAVHLVALVASWPVALACGLALGVLKEWQFDRYTGGDVDARDALATALGAMCCAILLALTH